MVKRGKIKEPFNSKPTNGKLPTIPAYMVCEHQSKLIIKCLMKNFILLSVGQNY